MYICSRVFSQVSSIFINNHQLLDFKYNTQPLLTPVCTRAPAPPTKYNRSRPGNCGRRTGFAEKQPNAGSKTFLKTNDYQALTAPTTTPLTLCHVEEQFILLFSYQIVFGWWFEVPWSLTCRGTYSIISQSSAAFHKYTIWALIRLYTSTSDALLSHFPLPDQHPRTRI